MQLSVIIPTRNRRDLLRQTLASLARVDRSPGEIEILIVDNGSTDGTRELVADAAAADRSIRYIAEPMPGLLSGRHRGALEAQGEVCAYLDDDVAVGREWLIGLADAFGDQSVVLVGGPSRPRFEVPAPDWLAEFYAEDERGRYCGWLSLVDCGARVTEVDPCLVWGLNYAVRKSTLRAVGGFHPDNIPKPLQRFQGDGETGSSLRIKRAGLKALYHPQVAVEHLTPASRLTAGYFEQRAFYQGVCDSFTRIREDGGVGDDAPSRGAFRHLARTIRRVLGLDQPGTGLRARTSASYRAGYAFHRGEVRRDPVLLAWALRDNYWDYALPEGWEQYMSRTGRAR